MTYTPGTPPPPAGDYYAPPGSFQPAPRPTRNGLAIAGFILAFLFAPIGFILSLIGLILASKNRQKGKVLAVFGMVISVLIMGIATTVALTVGNKVATIADPGCIEGKSAILGMPTASTDPTVLKTQLQDVIDKLDTAASHARHDNVRAALTAFRDDYAAVKKGLDGGAAPGATLVAKIKADGDSIDKLCTISTR